MPEGTSGILYDPQNTEDVKIYSATVPYNGNGTVVSACPCSDYDATVDWSVLPIIPLMMMAG